MMLLAGASSVGCTPAAVRLAEQGRLVAACRLKDYHYKHKLASWRVADAILSRTDIRLRFSPLTPSESETLVGRALHKDARTPLVELIRLELVAVRLDPGVSLVAELPQLVKRHVYRTVGEPWTRQRVAALLPPAPRLTLAELPVYRSKPPPRPRGVSPNKYVSTAVQIFTLGRVKPRGRGPTRGELRAWRKAISEYSAKEPGRRAAHKRELARVERLRADQTAAHQRQTAAYEVGVTRLLRALNGGCKQLRGKQLRFEKAGRCVLTVPLAIEQHNGALPSVSALLMKTHFELSDRDGRCSYQRSFTLEIPKWGDLGLSLTEAFKDGPRRLQSFTRDTSLAD